MNVEILAREAVNRIKENWGLPKSGFVAGGSIANIVWELVSGTKAVVNDIDVFVFDSKIERMNPKDKDSLFKYQEKADKYYEDYSGICSDTYTKYFYTIVESVRDGMINTIRYKSNTEDQSIIIKSFDINATKIGYSIDDDKIYWELEFEEFLKTGQLKVCNLGTPSHTSIRIAKKSKELNAKLDSFELKLLQFALSRRFSDLNKTRFKEKYRAMYEKNLDILKDFFLIKRDFETEVYVKQQFNEVVELYRLDSHYNFEIIPRHLDFNRHYDLFNDPNLGRVCRSGDFLFYMRHVYGNEKLKNIWSKLYFFFTNVSYVDKEVNQEDIDLLSRLAENAPNSIEHLRGYKLSEQIEIIKIYLDKFKDDPIVAISILEKMKIDKNMILDDQTALILELTVRKQIVNDTKGKVRKILNLPIPTISKVIDDQSIPDWF